MTTASKKSPAKKAAPKKTTARAAVTKKASVKKPVTKKTTAKRSVAKKQPAMRSFHVSADQPTFTTFQITRQTVYWIILVAFIIFVQLWILKLQIEVATLLDAQQLQLEQL